MSRYPILTAFTYRKTSLLITLRDFTDLKMFPGMSELVRKDECDRKIPSATMVSRRGLINEMTRAGLIERIPLESGSPIRVAITGAGRRALIGLGWFG